MITMSMIDDEWRKRRRRDPFNFFGIDDEFDRIFREMEHMMNRMFRDFDSNWIRPGSSFIHGFNIHFGSDGKPHIDQFGHRPVKTSEGKRSISDEREPLIDVIEGDEDVSITVEIPGVEKEDIDLNVTKNNLEISVDNPKRKYHRLIDLPCDVLPKTSKASYKNGILDIVIKRKEEKRKSDGFRVSIE